jgi:hypothetical protein
MMVNTSAISPPAVMLSAGRQPMTAITGASAMERVTDNGFEFQFHGRQIHAAAKRLTPTRNEYGDEGYRWISQSLGGNPRFRHAECRESCHVLSTIAYAGYTSQVPCRTEWHHKNCPVMQWIM